MDHYYSKKPSSDSQRKKIKEKIGGYSYTLLTDAGVFSKNKVDSGSKVLIHAAQKTNFPKGKILDLGCGYGVIGLALAKQFPKREVDLVDINERALALAADNGVLNQIDNINVYQSDIFENVTENEYAAIVSNPPIRAGKKVVHQILEESYDHLRKEGKLQIVIQRKQGAPSAKKKMKEVFGNVERIALDKGYWVLESIK